MSCTEIRLILENLEKRDFLYDFLIDFFYSNAYAYECFSNVGSSIYIKKK